MNNYIECFDDLLSAAENNLGEEDIKAILKGEKMRECIRDDTFRGDCTVMFIARDYAAGIRAAKSIKEFENSNNYSLDMPFFMPLLSGKNRRTAQLSCVTLAENFIGLYRGYDNKRHLQYRSMLYMFIVGDCIEAADRFLKVYRFMDNRKDCLSEFIRIGAKRKKTEMLKLFTKYGFSISWEDMKYLYCRDKEYADFLIEEEIIKIQPETDADKEKTRVLDNKNKLPKIKNWNVKAKADRIEFTGNVYGSQKGQPDECFYSFEAANCVGLNEEEFAVYERGEENGCYILKFSDKIEGYQAESVSIEEVLDFFQNNMADYDKLAELLLSRGDSLVIPGMGYTSRTVTKGEGDIKGDKPRCTYYYSCREKSVARSVEVKRKNVPTARMHGRDFYMCFDLLAEVLGCIMKDEKACVYADKIRKMFNSEIGIREKACLEELIFSCLRYYASEENYLQTEKLLYELGRSGGSIYTSCDFLFMFLGLESDEARKEAFKRIELRPDLNIFAIVPLYVGNLMGSVYELFTYSYGLGSGIEKSVCYFAEKRNRKAVGELAQLCGRIENIDLLELALRSPDTVYDFLQNEFCFLVPDNFKKGGKIKDLREMTETIAFTYVCQISYFPNLSYAYTYFDKKDFELMISYLPEIKCISSRDLISVYKNEANYCTEAYDCKPDMAYYFDKLFGENVHVQNISYMSNDKIKGMLRAKLRNHRFIIECPQFEENYLSLPKNFVLTLPDDFDCDKYINELLKSGDRRKIINAARHNLLNKNNIERAIRTAVENNYYNGLKVLYRIFGLLSRT